MIYTAIESRDGPVGQISRDGVSHAALMTNPYVAAAVNALGERIEYHASILLPERVPAAVLADAQPALAALGAGVDTAQREAIEFAASDAQRLAPPHNQQVDKFPETRALWRTFDEPTSIQRAAQASVLELSALIDGGQALSGLSDPAWGIVERRARLLFHIEKSGIAADHPMPPTLERIIATGPDQAAVEAYAQEAVNWHEQRRDRIELEEQSLQQVVTLLSIMTGLTRHDVLSRALAS